MDSNGSWDWQPVDPDRKAPELRASDADRQRAVDALLVHCTAGRLTLEELDERQGQAMQARTLTELRAVFHDLPDTVPDLPIAAHPDPLTPNRDRRGRGLLRWGRRRDRG
jgi:hypothetical protein